MSRFEPQLDELIEKTKRFIKNESMLKEYPNDDKSALSIIFENIILKEEIRGLSDVLYPIRIEDDDIREYLIKIRDNNTESNKYFADESSIFNEILHKLLVSSQ